MLFQKTNEARSLRILNELCNYLCLFFFPVIDRNFLEVIEKNQTGYNVRKGRLPLRRVLVLFGTYDRNVSAEEKKKKTDLCDDYATTKLVRPVSHHSIF